MGAEGNSATSAARRNDVKQGDRSGSSQTKKEVPVTTTKRPPLSVTFLGTSSGGGPIPSRNCSSLLLNLEKSSWLFDCAEGTQLQIQRSQWKTSRIERIFVTHMHADHTMGLAPLLGSLISGIQTSPESRSALQSLGLQKRAKIHIYGPPGLRLMIRQILNLTALKLGDSYAVHELIPNQATLADGILASTSPTEGGNGPSCPCNIEDLQEAEAIGQNIEADDDGCWRDIINKAESAGPASDVTHESQEGVERLSVSSSASSNIWRVDAGPIRHRVMSVGYVITEPPVMEALNLELLLPIISRQMEKITQSNPRLRHPRQVTTALSTTLKPFTLPDGQILNPPLASTIRSRKVVVMGDCAGTENNAFLDMADSPSLLVHECTNAWVDPRIAKPPASQSLQDMVGGAQAKEEAYEAQQKIQAKAKSRGHSDAQMAGAFAKSVSAVRLAVNHFSAMFPSAKYAQDIPFPSLTMPAYPLPPGRPSPPLPPGEITKRITMSNIESQITAEWMGVDGAGFSRTVRRAVTARDLMTYEVPSHELNDLEVDLIEQARRQAERLEKVWVESGPEGFAKETGCKLVGVWPDRPNRPESAGRGVGQQIRTLSSGNHGSGEAASFSEREKAVVGAHKNPSGSSPQLKSQGDALIAEPALYHTPRNVETPDQAKVEGKQVVTESSKSSSFHRHPTRHIALLFVYQGWHYSGLAIQQMPTPLPTVEGELLKALEKTHLIEAGLGWEGCEFSRCGRTDRGVSSAGQVVSLRIKSKRHPGDGGFPLHVGGDWQPPRDAQANRVSATATAGCSEVGTTSPTATAQERIAMRISGDYTPPEMTPEALAKMPLRQQLKAMKRKNSPQAVPSAQGASEYSYPHILNRVLPPEIRVLAWSPLPQDQPKSDEALADQFDARFSCVTRHYRYFFTRRPIPDHPPLDIDLMQAAATRLVGEHDFRNFCKVDGSKQIENHRRRVLKAVVRPDDNRNLSAYESTPLAHADTEDAYVFELVGSAFLWHQVRHIMSVLFHVGHGFETPEIVSRLLHTGYQPPGGEIDTIRKSDGTLTAGTMSSDQAPVASKPLYVMGAALPLQLYRCGYEVGAVDWRYGGYDGPVEAASPRSEARAEAGEGHLTVLNALKTQAEEARIKARQIEAFYQEAVAIHRPEGLSREQQNIADAPATSYTLGGGEMQAGRKYVPFLNRPRGDLVEEQNRRWREGKGENRRLRKLAESKQE